MVDAIIEIFADKSEGSKVLDAGCGEGRGVETLNYLGLDGYGLDLSQPKITVGSEKGLKIYFGDFHNMNMFSNKQFDYSFCSHALEHSLDPSEVVRELLRVSKEVYLIVPIDDAEQPPLGESPHTHNFYTNEQWLDFVKQFEQDTTSITNSFRTRLGNEVWCHLVSKDLI